jgi:serine protease Do
VNLKRQLNLGLAVLGAACISAMVILQVPERTPIAGSALKVLAGKGHGSAVHLGKGVILTAAHVVATAEKVEIRTDRGVTVSAEILWLHSGLDVALLRAESPLSAAASHVSCAPVEIGERVELIGNPGPFEFVHTRGRVASAVGTVGPYPVAAVIDVAGGLGMSGGPILNFLGEVRGIMVAIPASQGSYVAPLAIVVPASAICPLLAK